MYGWTESLCTCIILERVTTWQNWTKSNEFVVYLFFTSLPQLAQGHIHVCGGYKNEASDTYVSELSLHQAKLKSTQIFSPMHPLVSK